MVEQNQAMANQIRQEKLAAQANEQQQQQYFKDLGYPLASLSDLNNSDTQTQFNYYKDIISPKSGYAAGGPITMTLPMGGVPVTATFPARYASELEQIDIPHEINQAQNVAKEGAGMANGGYINTQPVNPNAFYPQSQIHSAQPYPAATPQRHEIIEGFEDGGMLDGPGDGMSDDIPANIDGEEEIRLADGEFVVPPDLVRMLGFGDPEKGADLLDNLLPIVRQAAHGKKEQIKQDAGKLAAEKMLARAVKGKA
jgi:type II secretory pathway pseudopilin PulG